MPWLAPRRLVHLIALCLALPMLACGASASSPVGSAETTGGDAPPDEATHAAATDPVESLAPPSVRFAAGASERACLPERTSALLLFASAEAPVLDGAVDPGAAVGAFGGGAFVLAPSDAHVRAASGRDSTPIDRAAAAAWGIDGLGALVEVELAPDAHGCEGATVVGVLSAHRLDASPTLPIDVGHVIAALLDAHREGTDARRALDDRALQSLDAQLHHATGEPHGPIRHRLVYGAAWSDAEAELTVLVAARVERDVVTTEANDADHAGRVWCEAPRGADCAPRCVPRTLVVTTVLTGESGTTVVFSRDGARVRTVQEPAGALAHRQSREEGPDDCR